MTAALSALVLALLLQAPGAAVPRTGAILRCDMGTSRAGGPESELWRTFRLGPNLFQEWKPAEGKFGPNLCKSFACSSDNGRLRGSITSSSLILTVELSPDRQRAAWKTVGASGLSRTGGACRVQVEKTAAPEVR